MGLLVDGVWKDQWYDTKTSGGDFVRADAVFRNWVTPDGAVGPSGEGGFRAEPGRYHIYVSLACPWAHRTLIFRKLKRLESIISVSVVDPFMGENGWAFAAPDGSLSPGSTRDELFGARHLHPRQSALFRASHRSCPVGHQTRNYRQQRIVRDHPDAEQRVRRMG
jgi:putative glutathione S-transferase